MAVRTRRRFAREARQVALDERRDRMLEPASLGLRELPRYTEMIDEQTLGQSLAPQRQRTDASAGSCREDAVPSIVFDVAVVVELLQHG